MGEIEVLIEQRDTLAKEHAKLLQQISETDQLLQAKRTALANASGQKGELDVKINADKDALSDLERQKAKLMGEIKALIEQRDTSIREKGKRHYVFFSEHLGLKGRVPGPDADQLDLDLKVRVILNLFVQLIEQRRFPLAVGAIEAEYFGDHQGGSDLGNLKGAFVRQPQVLPVFGTVRDRQVQDRQLGAHGGRFARGQRLKGDYKQEKSQ